MFKALVVIKNDDGKTSASIKDISVDDLPEGEILINVDYSSLNYKDGLCVGSGGGLVRKYPHVPGIDLAGVVISSSDNRFAVGDRVISTGWRVGENRWGGYAQKARVKADWLVNQPAALDSRLAMAVGTAGLTAMLAINVLEEHNLAVDKGPVLVTGAAGGVGSIATALLSNLGYNVTGVTGRPEAADYIKSLGATNIIDRKEIAETVKRPLETELWAGCIDAVGGPMLARVLGQMQYGSSVAAVGLAGGANLPASVIPFLLRSINLLGIDSVSTPANVRQKAWNRIADVLPIEMLEEVISMKTLHDLPELGKNILKGQIKGRVVIDVNA